MREPEASWQYDHVPPRAWSWYVAHDPGLDCAADKRVELSALGLAYTGNSHRPNSGGASTVGFQPIEVFLAEGALTADMPAHVAAELRAHLVAHRRPGPATVLVLVARLADNDPRRLARVDCHLDGVWLATPPLPAAEAASAREHLVFRGTVPAGAHTVSAALVLSAGLPRVAHAHAARVDVAAGTTLRAYLTLEPGTDRVVLET